MPDTVRIRKMTSSNNGLDFRADLSNGGRLIVTRCSDGVGWASKIERPDGTLLLSTWSYSQFGAALAALTTLGDFRADSNPIGE